MMQAITKSPIAQVATVVKSKQTLLCMLQLEQAITIGPIMQNVMDILSRCTHFFHPNTLLIRRVATPYPYQKLERMKIANPTRKKKGTKIKQAQGCLSSCQQLRQGIINKKLVSMRANPITWSTIWITLVLLIFWAIQASKHFAVSVSVFSNPQIMKSPKAKPKKNAPILTKVLAWQSRANYFCPFINLYGSYFMLSLSRIAMEMNMEVKIMSENTPYPNLLFVLKTRIIGTATRVKNISAAMSDIQGRQALQLTCIFLNRNQNCHIVDGQSTPLLRLQTLFNGSPVKDTAKEQIKKVISTSNTHFLRS